MERMHQEEILHSISGDYPEVIDDMKLDTMQPPVSEEYLNELCEGDEALVELLDEMLEYFYRYTRDVCEMQSLITQGVEENLEEIRAKDGPRTSLHNAMIDSVKILVRNLRSRDKDVSWIEPVDKAGRAGYARFALSTTLTDILKLGGHQHG